MSSVKILSTTARAAESTGRMLLAGVLAMEAFWVVTS